MEAGSTSQAQVIRTPVPAGSKDQTPSMEATSGFRAPVIASMWYRNPDGRSTVVGTVPREVSYTVAAEFETGIYDYDKAFVVLPMQDAQQLLLMGDQVGIIEIQTDNPDKVGQILAPLQKLVQGRGVVSDWRQMNSALFQALEVERVAMFVRVSPSRTT